MKINAIESFVVNIPYRHGGAPTGFGGRVWSTLDILFVGVHTDDGLSGWGEAFGYNIIPATKAALESAVAPLCIGWDASDIAGLHHRLEQTLHLFGLIGPITFAISGIDIALWDLAGKVRKAPLHHLLGGTKRAAIPAYASLLKYGEAAVTARNAERAVSEGYRCVKLHETDAAPVIAAKTAVGPDVNLCLDTNCPWDRSEAARMLKALGAYLYWLEEPIWPPNDYEGLSLLRAQHRTLIAAGENTGIPLDFHHLFAAGAVDIAQPSVTKCGGVTAVRAIASQAEAAGVRVVPHSPYFGPGFLATLHLAAALSAEPLVERLYVELDASPFGDLLGARAGAVRVPTGPGLGGEFDPDVVARYRAAPPAVIR